MAQLIDTSGIVRFEGTIDGALPTGWVQTSPTEVNANGTSINGLGALIFGTGVGLVSGTADPSAGAGRPATPGSLYLRAGAGELWLKTGAAATDWTKAAP